MSQGYALVHITMNGQSVSDVQLPWETSKTLSGLALGNYAISAETVTDSNGNLYLGQANPSMVNVIANETTSSTINYDRVQETGKIKIHVQNLPGELSNYNDNPTVLLTQSQSGNSRSQPAVWGTQQLLLS